MGKLHTPFEKLLLLTTLMVFGAEFARADGFLEKASAGRAPARNLKIKTSKVPTFEIHRAQGVIPRLDIGEEPVFKARTERAPAAAAPAAPTLKALERRPSPGPVVFDAKKLGLTTPITVKSQPTGKDTGPAPAVSPLIPLEDPQPKPSIVEARKIRPLSSAESRLLQAQIVREHHKDDETAMGLLVELLDDPSVQTEARFAYALAARRLGLHSEFRSVMMKIASETKSQEWGKFATEALVREVEALEISDIKSLSDLVQRHEVDTTASDGYNFYRAKYFLETGDLGQVEEGLKFIPEKSKYRADALLISALSAYRQGDISRSEKYLSDLLDLTSKENPLRSTGALTLARLHFQRADYKKAYDAYLQVDKSNALWLQAMSEQAWAQILSGDHEGAAGNMFSLHTDYFKNAFAPETYTARSVAYLNLCQYGDGLQVLGNFRRRYGPLVGRLEKYRSEKKAPQDDYETIRTWLRNSDLKEVSGLPRSFILELARHPSFMKTQQQINAFEDELDRFTKATLNLIQLEKDLIRKQSEVKEDLQKVRDMRADGKGSLVDLKTRIDAFEREVAALKIRYDLTKKARGLIKDVRARAIARIDKEKNVLKERASKALRQRLDSLTKELAHALEQNEVLRYEILAGAGEHLRAQSAGAETNDKQREQLKPADGKSVKWTFTGEIWEDEVGHYRSSLKNVCPKDDKLAAY